ncbi:MAG: hypothetical protein ABI180_01715 [Microcoleus sp.]
MCDLNLELVGSSHQFKSLSGRGIPASLVKSWDTKALKNSLPERIGLKPELLKARN